MEEPIYDPTTSPMYFLVFENETQALTELAPFFKTETDPDGNEMLVPVSYRDFAIELDIPIFEATGVMLTSEDGFEYPEMQQIAGYHVNLKLVGEAYRPQASALETYRVYPNTPSRTFL